MTIGCVTTCGAPPENARPLAVSAAVRVAAASKQIVILCSIGDLPSIQVRKRKHAGGEGCPIRANARCLFDPNQVTGGKPALAPQWVLIELPGAPALRRGGPRPAAWGVSPSRHAKPSRSAVRCPHNRPQRRHEAAPGSGGATA